MRADQLPPHKTGTYVMPQWKALYVSVNKAACTSLKWLVADLQDESHERFHHTVSSETSRAMTIHRRSRWQKTPMATELSQDELAAITPDNGWFIFGVVRHPSARAFSAWQSKLLMHDPWWVVDEYGTEPWFPRSPESTDDIVEDFERFILAMAEDPGQRLMRNRHFAPQRRILAPDRVPYTRIYTTRELDVLIADFESHLLGLGWQGNLQLRHSNETPLRPLARMFTPPVLNALQSLYQEDFETFGYDDVLPAPIDPSGHYPDAAIAEVQRLVERAERINDLAIQAATARSELAAVRERSLSRRARRFARRVRGFARRVRNRLTRQPSRTRGR